MKNLLPLSFVILFFTACVDFQSKKINTNLKVNKNTIEQQEFTTPPESAITKAKDNWKKTKAVCQIILSQIP